MSHPSHLGRYPVQRRLGAGAFATVYLAYDPHLDSPVAIKVLADNWSGDDHVRERFLGEGRLLRRVDSPHVVSVYDAGELDDGRPFLVMTYADAGTLVDQLQAGAPGSLDEAIEIVRQVGQGLIELHRQGIVHRDIKPANVLFRTSSESSLGSVRAMVADLGLGKVLDGSSKLTQIGGTPAYAAPEQARGERITEAADQYALGVLAYQLLEGRQPFSYDSLFAAQRPGVPDAMLGVRREVADVVLRALRPEPGQRWGSVAEFLAELVAAAPTVRAADRARLLNAASERTQLGSQFVAPEGRHDPAQTQAQAPPTRFGEPVEWLGDEGLVPGLAGSAAGPSAAAPPAAAEPQRSRWLGAVVTAVVAALVGGVAFVGVRGWAASRPLAESASDVTDSSGVITATVPGGWLREVGKEAWRPPGAEEDLPALSVGSAEGWQRSESSASGLFVGVAAGSDYPDALPVHPECTGAPARELNRRGLMSRTLTECPGGSVLVEEFRYLDLHRYVWIQARAGDQKTAERVVKSVEVAKVADAGR